MAEVVAAIHLAFVAFVVLGEVLILCGGAAGWAWIRRRGLRLAHLGAILFVAAEAALGIACPLTTLEARLRGEVSQSTAFVDRLVQKLLYWNLPEGAFTAIYLGFAVLVLWSWRRYPPRQWTDLGTDLAGRSTGSSGWS